jgi:hypothetical protein
VPRVWAPALLALSVAAAAPPPEPVTVLRLRERAPLALVLNTPSGEKGRLGVSEILAALGAPLDAHTDLELTAVDSGIQAECEGSLACLARRVPPGAKLLLVVSYFAAPQDRPDRLTALLVDVATADACASDPFGADDVDACVSERAVKVRPAPRLVTQAAEARAAFAELVQADLRPVLEGSGHWAPTGALEVAGAPTGATLMLDERAVGVAPGGVVRLEGVAPGPHQVAVHQGGAPLGGEAVVIARAETVRYTVKVGAAPSPLKTPMFWGGVGVAALGAGLTLWSAAYSVGNELDRGCFEPNLPCERQFVTVEQLLRGRSEVFSAGPNEGKVLALPLGYSLMLAGGTWALGSALTSEEDEVLHWILLGAGVVAGAAAYGISAAANGE